MTFLARDPATGARYDPSLWTRGELIPPNGCRWCGQDQGGHTQRWKPSVGWHTWEPPTDAQRLARMKARREARTRRVDAFLESARKDGPL